MMRRTIGYALLVGYAGAIFAVSELPVSTDATALPHADKWFHAAEFAVFFALAWNATGRRPLHAYGLTAFYAGTDELHQVFVPSRTASAWDLGADLGGALVALLVLQTVFCLWESRRRRILSQDQSKVES